MDAKNFVGLQALTPGSEFSTPTSETEGICIRMKLTGSARILDAPYLPEHGLLS
jgi:hypothetical protein